MPEMSEKEFEELIRQRLIGSNHDVYVKKGGTGTPFNKRPTSVYFYYFKWGPDGFADIRHYFYNNGKYPIKDKYLYPAESDEIGDIIRELALNAIRDDSVPPQIGQGFKGTKWRKKSYIVILMHNDDWSFCKYADGKRAVLFNPGGIKQPNHSFFDGRDLVVDVSPGGNNGELVTAICFINHMKRSENWDDLDGPRETQYFKFTLCFDVASKPGQTQYYDPDGTNLGPPQPPP